MKRRLTQALVDSIKADPTRDIYQADDQVSGFRLRVTPAGKKLFVFQYRAPDGRQRKLSLGSNLEEARRKAKEAAATLSRKEDPQAEKDRRDASPTLSSAADRWLADHVRPERKPSTARFYEEVIQGLPPELLARKLVDITPADLGALKRGMRDRRARANSIMATLSALYGWCNSPEVGIVPIGTNPAAGVDRYAAVKRSFAFEGDQLYRLNEALEKAEATMWPAAVMAMRLLLLTGCRKNEILHLRWSEVNAEAARLELSDSKSGARQVRLSAQALAVVEAARAFGAPFRSEYVFPSPRDRTKPIIGFQKMWRSVTKAAGLEEMRVHDMRHGFGSMSAATTKSAVHTRELLGHKEIATTGRYMHLAEDHVGEAARDIGEAFEKGMKPANVVALRGKA